jgi:hypothetical protein
VVALFRFGGKELRLNGFYIKRKENEGALPKNGDDGELEGGGVARELLRKKRAPVRMFDAARIENWVPRFEP